MFEKLKRQAERLGKPSWRALLSYVAELHERSTRPPRAPFTHPWEEIGPGYCYGPAFGHWDVVHQVLDVLPDEPEHARHEIENNLAVQADDGRLPGVIWMRDEEASWSRDKSHPPVWPAAVEELAAAAESKEPFRRFYDPLVRQIGWFEGKRGAEDGGFFYHDIVDRAWESGVDEGVRFDEAPSAPLACVDATAHVYGLYACAAEWAGLIGEDAAEHRQRAAELRDFIQQRLFSEETGFFHDAWSVDADDERPHAFEGMWPVVVGAASDAQAQRAVDENLLNPERFFTRHPISTVGASDPRFELRMWRGPAWNSMTYWAARGCLRYGRPDGAKALLERALDDSAAQFERTGTVWEFYHPRGGRPEDLRRKPHTNFNGPCRDYLGHNPVIAMARMWEAAG